MIRIATQALVALLALATIPAAARADSLRDEQGYSCVDYQVMTCVVLFDFDSAKITPRGRAIIELILVYGAKTKFDHLRAGIVGYTDRVGPAEYNKGLSLRRVEAVRDALVAGGFPEDQLVVGAMGELPAYAGHPESENRCVDIDLQE